MRTSLVSSHISIIHQRSTELFQTPQNVAYLNTTTAVKQDLYDTNRNPQSYNLGIFACAWGDANLFACGHVTPPSPNLAKKAPRFPSTARKPTKRLHRLGFFFSLSLSLPLLRLIIPPLKDMRHVLQMQNMGRRRVCTGHVDAPATSHELLF